jgi:cytoplasmic tRNA 2-thiolation protein 2
VNLISGIAQGAGFAVAEEAKEEWSPRPEQGIKVRVVRPMKDIGMKECAIWDWWNGLRVVGGSINVRDRGKNAIGALTRGMFIAILSDWILIFSVDFIFGLESDYPATVSTVARTCAKLTPKEGSNGVCIMCERCVSQLTDHFPI